MNRLFSQDNPVMKALSKLFEIGWLSILYLVFCVPIVTIGPATTALYYTAIKVLRRERGYVWSEFWGCFKREFKYGAILGIGFTLIYVLLMFNLKYVGGGKSSYGGYLYGIYLAMLIVVTMVLSYTFPVLSRLALKPLKVLRLALYMSIRHLQFTIIHLVILAVAVVGAWYSLILGLPILLLVIPGGLALVYTFPMEYILKKYQPKEEDIVTEDGEVIKAWYNE